MEKIIYDVGAHKGEDTEFYLKKGFSVVAIEAVPELCASLERKFSSFLKERQLKILNVAVSTKTGPLDFYIDENISVFGTLNADWVARNRYIGGGKVRKISVQTRSLQDITKEHGMPWYCKIDIEGNDLDALKSLDGSIDMPRFISIESEKRDWKRLLDEMLTFRELGYSRFKIVDQTLVELQKCPNPAHEGNYCDHVFQNGSSGLFGDEVPGTWISFHEAIEAYRHIFRGYALNGDNGLFRRGRGSIFYRLAKMQQMAFRARKFKVYVNPADILPPAAWYDTHAAR